MRVYVVKEVTADESCIIRVCRKHADAIAIVNRRFEDECEGMGWDPDEWGYTDIWGGALGDLAGDDYWIYWDITVEPVL